MSIGKLEFGPSWQIENFLGKDIDISMPIDDVPVDQWPKVGDVMDIYVNNEAAIALIMDIKTQSEQDLILTLAVERNPCKKRIIWGN